MISTEEIQDLYSQGTGQVVGEDGTKIGQLGQLFLDVRTGQPAWVTTTTGLFGGAESFVPLQHATLSGNEVRVPFDKDQVKDAPRAEDAEGYLSQDDEAELYRHYGMDYSESGLPTAEAGIPTDDAVGHDTSGPNTDDAMTRSEEQLHVGKETVSTGTARLRKYVVTENITQTVPVSHEEVRIEREPITDANRGEALAGGDITSEEHEVELTEERLVIAKETVPVERVRMAKETITEEQYVDEDIRKEQIESDTGDGQL